MRISLFILMLVAIATLTSCNKQNDIVNDEMSKTIVTFNASINDAPQSRSGENISRYIMEISEYIDGSSVLIDHIEQDNGSFSVALNPENEYSFYFWADEGTVDDNTNGTYDASNFEMGITLNEGKEVVEAYYSQGGLYGLDGENNIAIVLRRAVAELSLIEIGNTVTSGTPITVTYRGNTEFQIYGNAYNTKEVSRIITPTVTNGKIGTLLMLASSSGELVDITASYGEITNKIVNVPIKANWITNLSGKFGEKAPLPEATFEVSTDQNWDGEMITDQTNIDIPDAEFKNILLYQFDLNKDGEISKSEASLIIDFRYWGNKIKSLVGIEHFVQLEGLFVNPESISNIDLSKCVKLKSIYLYGGALETLDISGCTELSYLDCQYNKLTNLNVSTCTKLNSIYCAGNLLTTLDLSNTNVGEQGEIRCYMESLETLILNKDWEGNVYLDINENTTVQYK